MPNTRELAQIIDRETGDVNNLRDKKLADATAQQQSGSASTDSVVMKTTGGEYVEIARDSFVGAIKGVMDGLIKGNSYTTLGANDPIAAFNSNALGGITPANLASVLGVDGIKNYLIARLENCTFGYLLPDSGVPTEVENGIISPFIPVGDAKNITFSLSGTYGFVNRYYLIEYDENKNKIDMWNYQGGYSRTVNINSQKTAYVRTCFMLSGMQGQFIYDNTNSKYLWGPFSNYF